MRANEFISEVATIKPVSSQPPGSAPTLGKPVAAKQDPKQALLKNLGNAGNANNNQQDDKAPGFMGGLAQGFKKGMNMDPDQSIASNLAGAGLNKLGLSSTADAAEKSATATGGQQQTVRPGQSVKDPVTGRGNVRILPNPGNKGIKLDTTRSLGYPIIVDPKDLA
jgi:hypothetical protein